MQENSLVSVVEVQKRKAGTEPRVLPVNWWSFCRMQPGLRPHCAGQPGNVLMVVLTRGKIGKMKHSCRFRGRTRYEGFGQEQLSTRGREVCAQRWQSSGVYTAPRAEPLHQEYPWALLKRALDVAFTFQPAALGTSQLLETKEALLWMAGAAQPRPCAQGVRASILLLNSSRARTANIACWAILHANHEIRHRAQRQPCSTIHSPSYKQVST